MLDLMRKHARSWLIKVALGGIIVVFIFFFGWSGPGQRSQDFAATVNGKMISYGEFYNTYESELAKIRLRFKGSVPQELFDKLNLKEQVLDSLIDQTLLVQEAERLGMFLTDKDLIDAIHSDRLFQRDGVFDPAIYAVYLTSIKMTPQHYEEVHRRQMLAMQLVQFLTDSVKADPEELKKLWHFQNDKIILSCLFIKPEPQEDTPDPEALESYFKKNQAKYEIPATVNLKYVALSWRDAARKVSVTDQEALSYYDNNPKEFLVPERIRARHLLLEVPEGADATKKEEVHTRAKELLARIRSGGKFEEVAKVESQDQSSAAKGGDLGFFSRGTMNPDFERAAFKLKEGEVSEPVLTDKGWHLIMVEEKAPEKTLEFDLAKDKIVAKLTEEKAKRGIDRDVEEFYEQVYRSEDLERLARKFGYEVKDAPMLTKNGSLPDIGPDPKVAEEAFSLKIGEISRLLKSGDHYVILKLVEKNKERLPNLDEVRSSVEKDYLKQRALESAQKRANEIIEALKQDPKEAEKIAGQFGLKWEDQDPVSRVAGFAPRLGRSPEVTEMITTVSPDNSLFPKPITVSDGVAVVRLAKVNRAGDEQYSKEAPAFERWILEVRKTDFLKGWIRKLKSKAQIEINRKLL